MHRSGKSEKKKISSNPSNYYSSIRTVTENPWGDKNRNKKTNHINSSDPTHSLNNVDEGMTHTRPLIPDVPFHPGPTYRPPLKLIRSNIPRSQESSQSSDSSGNTNINPDINFDFEENSPFQGVISEAYHRPDMSFLQEP